MRVLPSSDEVLIRIYAQNELAVPIAEAKAQIRGLSTATAESSAATRTASAASDGWITRLRTMGGFTTTLARQLTGLAAVFGPLALAGSIAYAVKESAEFEAAMMRVHTQAGASMGEVHRLTGEVLKLAPAVGFGPVPLADALYHVESVGYRGADAMKILQIAAEAAQIGNASLDDTTYALTSTMKTFSLDGVGGAQKAMGLLNAIVGQGDMRMQDLNKAIQTGVLSTAQTFGVSMQSVGAALDFLTDRGEKANVASTRLSMGITMMAAPSKIAAGVLSTLGLSAGDIATSSAAMSEALAASGLTQNQLALDLRKPDGLYVALTHLKGAMDRNGIAATDQGDIIARVFGGARTGKAVMALYENLEQVRQKYDQVGKQANQFGEDWAKTQDTLSFKLKAFTAAIEVDAVKAGDFFKPMLLGLLDGIGGLGKILSPLGSDIADVWGQVEHLLGSLKPVAGIILAAFGGAVMLAVTGLGYALRDVIAPAIRGVADGLDFLSRHRELVIALATAITVFLLPAIAAWLNEMRILIAVRLLEFFEAAVTGAETAGAAIKAFLISSGPLLALAAVIGGVAAAIMIFGKDTRNTTVDVNNFTEAIKKQVDGMGNGDLKNSILGQISSWKPTSGSTDGLTYLQKYNVNVGALANSLADPKNQAAWGDFLKDIGNAGSFALLTGQKFGGSASKMSMFQSALNSTNPAVHQLAVLFSNLEKDPTVNGKTITHMVEGFNGLSTTLGGLRTKTQAYADAQKEANKSLSPAEIIKQASATQNLDLIQKGIVATQEQLDANNKNYQKSVQDIGNTVAQQFPIFQEFRHQLALNADQLVANARSEVVAMEQETNNIATLVKNGASAATINTLYKMGPDQVAAAAKSSLDQIKLLNQSTTLQALAQQGLITQIGLATGDQYIQAQVLGQQTQQGLLEEKSKQLQIQTFDKVGVQLIGLAQQLGRNVPDNVASRLISSKGKVIDALDATFTGPQKTAVSALENLATSGGSQMGQNLANAIENHTPLVVSKMAAQKDGLNAQVRAILATWGITVTVDDQASQKLAQINQDIKTLGLTGVAAPNFTPSFAQQLTNGNGRVTSFAPFTNKAAGGLVDGPGSSRSDSIPTFLSKGEFVVNADDTAKNLSHLFALNAGAYASGGLVGGETITINADAVVDKLLVQSQAQTAISKQVADVGSGVQRWAPLVLQALAMEGLPSMLLGRVLNQMQLESGGNPNAINLWDSNAAKGVPSKGLMQTIDPTFMAYHWPGTSTNVYDPLANIASAINYGRSRYGISTLGMGLGHGYDNGGLLMPGKTAAVNYTGTPEPVLTGMQWRTMHTLASKAAVGAIPSGRGGSDGAETPTIVISDGAFQIINPASDIDIKKAVADGIREYVNSSRQRKKDPRWA